MNKGDNMKRTILSLLLATTATCYGQSNEEILNSTRSSDMSADSVEVIGSSYTDEFEQWTRQSNEATQRHFDTIRQEEGIEALQQEDSFYSPIQPKYDQAKHYKQHERSSATDKGQHLPGRYSTSYHTTSSAPVPAPLHDSSKGGSHKPSGGNVYQRPK